MALAQQLESRGRSCPGQIGPTVPSRFSADPRTAATSNPRLYCWRMELAWEAFLVDVTNQPQRMRVRNLGFGVATKTQRTVDHPGVMI